MAEQVEGLPSLWSIAFFDVIIALHVRRSLIANSRRTSWLLTPCLGIDAPSLALQKAMPEPCASARSDMWNCCANRGTRLWLYCGGLIAVE